MGRKSHLPCTTTRSGESCTSGLGRRTHITGGRQVGGRTWISERWGMLHLKPGERCLFFFPGYTSGEESMGIESLRQIRRRGPLDKTLPAGQSSIEEQAIFRLCARLHSSYINTMVHRNIGVCGCSSVGRGCCACGHVVIAVARVFPPADLPTFM